LTYGLLDVQGAAARFKSTRTPAETLEGFEQKSGGSVPVLSLPLSIRFFRMKQAIALRRKKKQIDFRNSYGYLK